MYVITILLILLRFSISINGDGKIGGDEAKEGEYPFVVCLKIERKPECHANGILLNWFTTLTACHAIHSGGVLFDTSSVRVYAGAIKPTIDTEWRTVLELRRHPLCEKVHSNKLYMSYDYGIVITRDPFPENIHDRIMPFQWVQTDFLKIKTDELIKRGISCKTVGWGWKQISKTGAKINTSKILRSISATLINYDQCDIAYYGKEVGNDLKIQSKGKICTRDLFVTKGPCGDPGAPLICDGYIVAIRSESQSTMCGGNGKPSVYSRIDFVGNWLKPYQQFKETRSTSFRLESTLNINILTILSILASFAK